MNKNISPLGQDHRAARRRRMQDPEYAQAARELAPYEVLARMVIRHRMDRNLTQAELAAHIGSSESAISRLESGQHRPNVETLQKLARAFDRQLVIGFTEPIAESADEPIHAKLDAHEADLVVLAQRLGTANDPPDGVPVDPGHPLDGRLVGARAQPGDELLEVAGEAGLVTRERDALDTHAVARASRRRSPARTSSRQTPRSR